MDSRHFKMKDETTQIQSELSSWIVYLFCLLDVVIVTGVLLFLHKYRFKRITIALFTQASHNLRILQKKNMFLFLL